MLKQFPLNLIGQDTEFFLWDPEKEKVIPSYKYFGKKEEEPKLGKTYHRDLNRKASKAQDHTFTQVFPPLGKGNLDASGNHVHVYRDGLAVEVNSEPTLCRAWLWQDVKLSLVLAEELKMPPRPFTYTSRPVVEVSPQLRAHFPEDLRRLGCNPTLDAYTKRQKVILLDPMKLPFRTSGSHLHSSFPCYLPEECWEPIVKLSDLLIGGPFSYIFHDPLEFKRRTLYGQAGEFRFQDYTTDSAFPCSGVEYRVLSSRLYNHPGVHSLFTGIWKYVVLPNYAFLWEFWDKAWEDDIREAINLGSEKAFQQILPLGQALLEKIATSYTLAWDKTPPKEVSPVWTKLRLLNEEGAFPDAGVINNPHFPEAHRGWTEYRTDWDI